MHIGHISTFSPTCCGIATYAESLISNLKDSTPHRIRLLYHCDIPTSCGPFELKIEDRQTYHAAAAMINESEIDLVSLQHEFAIFGGEDGEYVLELAAAIKRPIVTTLHTTPTLLSEHQKHIVQDLVDRSSAVVVLTEQAKLNLLSVVKKPVNVSVIRHGVPAVEFSEPEQSKLRTQWVRRHVFHSAGHVSDRKGYTNTLAAFAELLSYTRDFLYVLIGKSQPQFGSNSQSVSSLKRMINDYGLRDHVLFLDEFVDLEVLLEHILASDAGIVAYTDCQQSSSGMVPMTLGCGRPVIATPFEYVRTTAAIVPGLYICEGYQSRDILKALLQMIELKESLATSMHKIYAATRPWLWSRSAAAYTDVFKSSQSAFGLLSSRRARAAAH